MGWVVFRSKHAGRYGGPAPGQAAKLKAWLERPGAMAPPVSYSPGDGMKCIVN